jgi:MFS family permease
MLSGRNVRINAWLAWVGAAVALTGVQLIAPSLPVMKETLGLTDTQLALVMSVYLLPAALATIPIGLLADRFGRRPVFGGALLLFGATGILLALVDSFSTFLVIRFVQGIAFAGLLPLTMTILGDAFTGPDLVGAQGNRSVAMSLGDGILPVVGGLLVAGGWFVPWLGQALAIPLGIVVLLRLVDTPAVQTARSAARTSLRALAELFRSLPILALQYGGILRMFLKFCILTFLPVFLVDTRGLSPAFAGLAVGIAAVAGTAIAAFAGRLARIGRPSIWVLAGIIGMGVGLIAIVTFESSAAIIAVSIAYGAADGLMGVFTNSLVTAATSSEQRASFVSATGALRNFAKFAAPAVFAVVSAQLGIATSFIVIGAITVASSVIALAIRPIEADLLTGPVRSAT